MLLKLTPKLKADKELFIQHIKKTCICLPLSTPRIQTRNAIKENIYQTYFSLEGIYIYSEKLLPSKVLKAKKRVEEFVLKAVLADNQRRKTKRLKNEKR